MLITKKEYKSVGEYLYSGELENGLKIFVIPKQGYNSQYAVFGTHYGGAMRRFAIDGETIDTPAGVAHFLEHKMFDMPDGSNALTTLSENGADANAFTSSDLTCYHFSCTEHFEENLRILLQFVSTPYYTPETVQKEQGIIAQEIQMGDDSPGRQVYYDLLSLLYAHHPIKDAVVGTVESIAEITDQTLYHCHRVFYAPSNMVLCVEGDVNPERVFEIANEVLGSERKSIPQADFGEKESDLPLAPYKERQMPVGMPEFLIGEKISNGAKDTEEPDGKSILLQRLTAGLALRLLAGASSSFYTRLYADGVLTRDFDVEIDYAVGTATMIIGGQSPDPEKVLQELLSEVDRIREKGFNKAYFSRTRKAMIGGQLRGLEDFDGTCVSLLADAFDGFCTLDVIELLPQISRQACEQWIADTFKPEKLAMAVIRPLTEE
ncbi:MAG: insulinase family protein [Oscillospiraceae bacterium]|nr:insulinase family protein [Oscillospiraceae bacterium]